MLKLNGVPLNLIKDFRGREGTSETGIRFANPADLPLLTDLQSNYPIVTGHLAWCRSGCSASSRPTNQRPGSKTPTKSTAGAGNELMQ
ncbi:hypothetical protein SIAM614_28736 [Stappia aggregata IAM 12614]|uniref:Uncharacterized protein n=1 Tax=Roseibium aggregatum (strain ATCC 25650 / DSM 13394 / JCM 20685 / NBRC 16684 / NCIMB 2208 / IAM 12614 / B1) TaxID=384765 RepID=A0P3V3_ROSAI|nr:hypothetical protein [Roseibium aggregatum]EAV40297.1 hypothetical protein SIAM614_28736 [Stappia aggregata IAM 12614] [Roseibium aggregatum IAM 12614]